LADLQEKIAIGNHSNTANNYLGSPQLLADWKHPSEEEAENPP